MSNRLSLSLLIAVALLFGCAPVEPPVGELAIDPSSITMSYPQFVRVTLTWAMAEPLAELSGTPRVFLHLIDESGEVVRTFDHDFAGDWHVGSETSYEVVLSESALVPALPEGQYALTAGLYDEAGHRWSLAVAGEEVRPQEYRIATVTAESKGEGPQFFFASTWLPVEGGTDMQILGCRTSLATGLSICVWGFRGVTGHRS